MQLQCKKCPPTTWKRIVPRDDKILQEEYFDLMEMVQDHEVIEDKAGTYRWKPNKLMEHLYENHPNQMNSLVRDYHNGKFTTEEFMRFYRDTGYSLSGYEEVWGEIMYPSYEDEDEKIIDLPYQYFGKYTYSFPVGDWSDDGHGKCEYYTVEGNKPMSEVAIAHRSCKEKHGFEIGDICHEYEDQTIDEEIVNTIRDMGIEIEKLVNDYDWVGSDELIEIWIAILNVIDPDLQLKKVNDGIAEFNNWSCKPLETPGYGCFE